ncbi:MAG TPA: hypothetical protein VFX96_05315, partial [Pyrinomonadaceae bacterium]|nr:hypothetical protein [Pyrinomonadaceae bacterium]
FRAEVEAAPRDVNATAGGASNENEPAEIEEAKNVEASEPAEDVETAGGPVSGDERAWGLLSQSVGARESTRETSPSVGSSATTPTAHVAPHATSRRAGARRRAFVIARRRAFVIAAAAVAAAVASALIILSASLVARRVVRPRGAKLMSDALRETNISRLTRSGNVTAFDLSPDGQYVAYAEANGDAQSLFVRHVLTTSVVEIVAPAPVSFRGVTFSRDGAWVFYVTRAEGETSGVLHRVSVLGGPAAELARDVDSPVTLSPEGDRLAFVRLTPATNETALVVANADGTSERRVAVRGADDGFSFGGPAWSPDGRRIACGTYSFTQERRYASLLTVEVADGSTRAVGQSRWNWLGRVAWLADGSALLVVAWDSDSEVMSDQIWLVAYPEGDARRVTNDVNGYLGVGSSSDARVAAAASMGQLSSFWVAPKGDWARARRVTNGFGDPGGEQLGLAWTPDARLLYATGADGAQKIWVMGQDGTGRRQLTAFDFGAAFSPAASPDGRFVYFIAARAGRRQLWRMNSDGGGAVALTDTEGDNSPSVTPDGRWVVYATYNEGRPTIRRIPSEGGAHVQLTTRPSLMPSVAPDGRTVACFTQHAASGRWRLTLLAFDDGRIIRQFEPHAPTSTPALRWTADGRMLTYVVTRGGVSNVWGQPIEGGAPRQLTAWTADRIYRFDWSRDGALACERGTAVSDVILIRDARGE